MKYTIKKIIKIAEIDDIYTKFIKFSPDRNIFCSSEILKFYFDDLDLFTVCKSNEIKAFVYLLKDLKGSITSDPFIYSGIINHPKSLMKNSRYNNEVFKINELIVHEIFSKYKNLSINLPISFVDVRPFLWFNFDQKDVDTFRVIPRYTSIIDLKSKDEETLLNEIDDVKRRDIKKVLKNNDYKVSDNIDLSLMKKFYKDTMKRNKGTFDNSALNKIFDFISLQAKEDKVIQRTTFFQREPLYSVLCLHDDVTSCYLYGAGNVEIKNRYAGSLALWKAIQSSIHKKLLFMDLEGINSPFRGEYKICFGGNIQSYYKIISSKKTLI